MKRNEPTEVEAEGEPGIIRAVVVGVLVEGEDPAASKKELERRRVGEELDELEALLDTLGAKVVARLVQVRKSIDAAYYIGRGKAEALRSLLAQNQADVAVFDDDLSPAQNRNLEKLLGKEVMDRTGVILEIFSKHARTSQAKLQVELAHLRYLMPRLKRAWVHLSRQKGGVNQRGEGEKQIELDRRLIRQKISLLEDKIEKLDVQRDTRREGRRELFKAAIVGYTNSGKSTLMNALTGADVLVEDKLFATLDPTVRRMNSSKGLPIMLSDTVGFIRKLPHALVASFRSTLEETRYSDLLIEVVDLSSAYFEHQKAATDQVLDELGNEGRARLLVFNKIDALPKRSKLPAIVRSIYPRAVAVSARTGEGLDELRERIVEHFSKSLEERTLELGHDEGAVLSEIYEHAMVESVEYRDKVVVVKFRASPQEHHSIDRLLGRAVR